jgi:hypothetical protein
MGTSLRRAKHDTLAWGSHNNRQPVKRLAGLFLGFESPCLCLPAQIPYFFTFALGCAAS